MIKSDCARKKPNLTRLVVVLSLIAPVAGCGAQYLASDSNIVALKYTPDEEKSGPLGRLPPLKIALAVRDQRAASEQDRVGIGRTSTVGSARGIPAKVISQNDPRTILADAMADALHRNGHTIVQAADVTADVLLQVQLKRFMSYPIELMDFGSILESSFEMETEIMTGRGNNRILLKPIRTIYRKQFVGAGLDSYRDVLNDGLVRFIRSFATDHEVVEALRSVSQKAGS
jgi:hypothetical protein